MNDKFNGICLKKTSYKDNAEMLSLFTLERGRLNCALIGAKKPNAKLKFCGESFCFAEYVLSEKSDRRSVIEANEIDCFYGLREDIDRYYSAAVAAEFLLSFLPEGESNYDLFLLTVRSLKNIEVSAQPYLALVYFLIGALNSIGYLIDFGSCGNCGGEIENRAFFDFDDSSALCSDCAGAGATEIRTDTYHLIKTVSSKDIDFFKNADKSTYSGVFTDKKTMVNALKFFDYYMSVNLGSSVKTLKTLIEMNK